MKARTPTYWLSMHLPYACRHSGACCSSGWDIPIERSRVGAVQALRPATAWLRPVSGAPEEVAGVLAMSGGGRCVFHGDGCEIQHGLGHGALPSACQHFPRKVLMDPRGVFVTLSHYCPTAADLLFSHVGPVEIVEGPPVLPDGDPEGLDARDVLPPLLTGVPRARPRGQVSPRGARSRQTGPGLASKGQVSSNAVLMDLESYAAWEAHMIRVLTCGTCSADEALAQLDADLMSLQNWRPGSTPLLEVVHSLRSSNEFSNSSPSSQEAVIKRYLAARAFASWVPYQAEGVPALLWALRRLLEHLQANCERMCLKDAIRETDLRLVHLASLPV